MSVSGRRIVGMSGKDVETYHHEKAVCVYRAYERGDNEAVPALMRIVDQRVGRVGEQERHSTNTHPVEGYAVVFFCLFFCFA